MKIRMRILYGILIYLLSCTFPLHSQVKEKYLPIDTITTEALRHHIYFLASDALEGRGTATEGFKIASEYAASQFQAAGVKPVITDENGQKTYFQKVPLIHKILDPQSVIHVKSQRGEHAFVHGNKCIVALVQNPEDMIIPSGSPVYVGYGISEPEAGWDDYEGLDVRGKIVLCLSGSPYRNGKPVLPESLSTAYADLVQGSRKKIETAKANKAVAVVYLLDPVSARGWDIISKISDFRQDVLHYPGMEPTYPEYLLPIIPVLLVHPDNARLMFEGENYDPMRFFETGKYEDYKRFVLKNTTMTLKLGYKRMPVSSRDVVAMVPGTDPGLSHQVITVGAHLDHIGIINGEIYNGADDNASGSAALMEIAESVAMSPPRRPVLFVLYTGEEDGSYGSRFFTSNCPVPLEDVIVNINMDMLGRESSQVEKRGSIQAFGPLQFSPELYDVLVTVDKRTEKIPLFVEHEQKDIQRFITTGDHQNWYRQGIPFVCFCDFGSEDLHKPTDDPEKIDFNKIKTVSRLVYELVVELGNRDKPLSRISEPILK